MISLVLLSISIVYFIFATFVTFWMTGRVKKRSHQILVFLTSISIFTLIPTWDIIFGRIYFNHLCEKEGGIKVYKKLKLQNDYWDENGKIRKNIISRVINTETKVLDESNNIFHIRESKEIIIDKINNELLGTNTYFIYFGGWVINNSGLLPSGILCPPIEHSSFDKLLNNVIVQSQ